MYSKKVPSNGSTFHDSDKAGAKRPKLKKGMKEDKVPTTEDTVKAQDQDASETKKVKVSQAKHTKGFGKEESSIQALNQATEQTLHVRILSISRLDNNLIVCNTVYIVTHISLYLFSLPPNRTSTNG